jgi:hypothetical protein
MSLTSWDLQLTLLPLSASLSWNPTLTSTTGSTITEYKLKTKIFLPENMQIWYQTALVIFFQHDHRLCENNHEQFQANDAGLETKHANVELCPSKGATHIWIKISKLDEYGLPLANMTAVSIVYYCCQIDNDNVKHWEKLGRYQYLKGTYNPLRQVHYTALSRLVAILQVVLMAAKKRHSKLPQLPRFFCQSQKNLFIGIKPSLAQVEYAEHEISEEAYRMRREQVERYKVKEVQFWHFETLDHTCNP